MVEKREAIKEYIDAAATRGGLTEPELAVLATLAAANEVLFPTSVLDLIPGAGKAVGKTGDLIKAGVRAEDAAKVAMAEAKTAELGAKEARAITGPVYQTTKEATKAAESFGFKKINETVHEGQAVYKKGNYFITRDLDGHNGGAWKMAKSVEALGKKETRMGTYNINLNRIGD